jgi:acetamidase/formamidase
MKHHTAWIGGCLLAATVVSAQTPGKTHELKATPETTFYRFLDQSLMPVLTINSGDIVKLETTTGTPGYFERLGVPKDKIPAELHATFQGAANDGARRDHTLTGPIYITGAALGDSLEIRLRSIDLRLPLGGQAIGPNGGTLPGEFATQRDKVLYLDLKKKTVEYAPGVVVPLNKPFWGSISVVPPASVGRVTDQRPSFYGANMDNSDLTAGTTLYLPVFVPGALLSLGDGHAAQGHGEVGGSAIETSLKGEIQVILHKGKTLRLPRAETPTEYMTMGFHEDLDEAVKIATREMLDWLVEMKGITRDDAYLLASAAMDLRITQVVDGAKGVHAVIAKSIFTR